MYWYVLFTKTGCEEKVEKRLKKQLDNNLFTPFLLMEQILFKRSGQVKKVLRPIFPGYVFIESEASRQEIIKETRDIFYTSQDIFYFVKYGDTGDIAMREQERDVLQKLFNDNRWFTGDILQPDGMYLNSINFGWKGDPSYNRQMTVDSMMKLIHIETDMILPGHGKLCLRNGTSLLRYAAQTAFTSLR